MSIWRQETYELTAEASERTPDIVDLEVTNPNVDGLALRESTFCC